MPRMNHIVCSIEKVFQDSQVLEMPSSPEFKRMKC